MKSNIKNINRNTLTPPPITKERLAYVKELIVGQNMSQNSHEEMKNTPFTIEEERIMQLIIEAHNQFTESERMHPMEMQEWVYAIHQLQSILSHRAMKRLFPTYFK